MRSSIAILNIVLALIIFGANGHLWSRVSRRFARYLLVLSEFVVTGGLALDVVALYLLHAADRASTYTAYGVAFVLCSVLAVCTSYAVHFLTRRKVCK